MMSTTDTPTFCREWLSASLAAKPCTRGPARSGTHQPHSAPGTPARLPRSTSPEGSCYLAGPGRGGIERRGQRTPGRLSHLYRAAAPIRTSLKCSSTGRAAGNSGRLCRVRVPHGGAGLGSPHCRRPSWDGLVPFCVPLHKIESSIAGPSASKQARRSPRSGGRWNGFCAGPREPEGHRSDVIVQHPCPQYLRGCCCGSKLGGLR